MLIHNRWIFTGTNALRSPKKSKVLVLPTLPLSKVHLMKGPKKALFLKAFKKTLSWEGHLLKQISWKSLNHSLRILSAERLLKVEESWEVYWKILYLIRTKIWRLCQFKKWPCHMCKVTSHKISNKQRLNVCRKWLSLLFPVMLELVQVTFIQFGICFFFYHGPLELEIVNVWMTKRSYVKYSCWTWRSRKDVWCSIPSTEGL